MTKDKKNYHSCCPKFEINQDKFTVTYERKPQMYSQVLSFQHNQ